MHIVIFVIKQLNITILHMTNTNSNNWHIHKIKQHNEVNASQLMSQKMYVMAICD